MKSSYHSLIPFLPSLLNHSTAISRESFISDSSWSVILVMQPRGSPNKKHRLSTVAPLLGVVAETCFSSSCLAMDISSDSTIPAFRRHVTIFYYYFWYASTENSVVWRTAGQLSYQGVCFRFPNVLCTGVVFHQIWLIPSSLLRGSPISKHVSGSRKELELRMTMLAKPSNKSLSCYANFIWMRVEYTANFVRGNNIKTSN
jgi:hypothetical protein